MNKKESKAVAIVLLIIFLSFLILNILPYSQNCNQICFVGGFSNSYINGTLYFNKLLLKNTAINIVLNNKQSAIYHIPEDGKFNFYIPFNLGYNNIDLYYGKYKDSIGIFYFGDFSNFIIFIGAVFCYFIIKEFSDFKSESSSVRLRYKALLNNYNSDFIGNINNINNISNVENDNLKIDKIIKNAVKKANLMQIVKNTAFSLDLLNSEDTENTNYFSLNNNANQLENIIYEIDNRSEIKNNNYLFSDMVTVGDRPLKSIITKKLYDYSLNTGNLKINEDSFLEKNNIILLSELNQNEVLKIRNSMSNAKIALLLDLEKDKLIELISETNPTSALLLSMILLKKVDILAF